MIQENFDVSKKVLSTWHCALLLLLNLNDYIMNGCDGGVMFIYYHWKWNRLLELDLERG